MKVIVLISIFLALAVCDHWAILVAGSNTYSNYRHQADVYHAYHTLIKGGFDQSKIITLAYDDIANNIKNPFKGKVFNRPTEKQAGVDVYAGIKIDYTKSQVTPQVFQAVLEGNKQYVKKKGTQRVLQSTKEDNVFIFFSDHGAPGLIAFPNKYLYADQLISSFAKINGKYNKLVFYLESCESGSMFTKLPQNTKIWALSAANPTQSSWGTYCSPHDVVQGKHIGSCLGDLFSINFLQDTDKGNYQETLQQQYQIIKKLTDKSHVLAWGDNSFSDNQISEFLVGPKRTTNLRFIRQISRIGDKDSVKSVMDSRTMKLQSLSAIYARDRSPQVFNQMMEQMADMRRYERIFNAFSKQLNISGSYNAQNINFECLRPSIDFFEAKCSKFSDYGLSFIKYIAHACQKYDSTHITNNLKC